MKLIAETPFSVKHGKMTDAPDTEIWIRGKEDPKRLARDIKAAVNSYEYVDLACIGASAINQAIKAVAIAREKMRTIVCVPYFSLVTDEQDNERTRMVLRITACRQDTSGRA